jgi:hypothetical protein
MTSAVLAFALTSLVGPIVGDAHPMPWGFIAHEMAAREAVRALPGTMPAFFRAAGDQLVYLDPEPDKWRNYDMREMDQAFSYDHYIDMENVPEGALDAPDRFTYLAALYEAGLPKPERDAGFLPYRIIELYQRVVTEFRMWRNETDPTKRGWIEQRIINDAGVLGHYVTDASQPHHATIHFNGWNSSDAFGNAWPNPEGYAGGSDFHSRFERYFVEAHVNQEDIHRQMPGSAPVNIAGQAREGVLQHIAESSANVETLYRLERDIGFDPEGPLNAETRDFAAERLASGGAMLSVLWWSAWNESGS